VDPPRDIPDRLDLVEESVRLRGRDLAILRPRSAEALLDDEAFEHEEFLPYWAELWASGAALASFLEQRELDGLDVLELGCGLGLPSLAAALAGAHVLATDWSPDAVALLRDNAQRNGVELEAAVVRWSRPERILRRDSWDLLLAADVLYERRNVDELLSLLPRLGAAVLLADPGRPHAKWFLEQAAPDWTIDEVASQGSVTVRELTLRTLR
jgi:predicted nicotinamide N-methyase